MVNVSPSGFSQLAKISLDLLGQVSIKAGDQELETVSAVRQMLRGIATGQLIVGSPVLPAEKAKVSPVTTLRDPGK